MTPAKKKMYVLGMIAIFLTVIPVLILYSSGYRVTSKLKLVKTGGIYLANDMSGVVAKINGKEKKKAELFDKNMLIQNVRPGKYHVTVEKEGYRVWEKNITVDEHKVEVCFPLLIPNDLKPVMIPKYITGIPMKKGEKPKRAVNDEFLETMELFRVQDKPAKGMIPGWESSDIKKFKLGADRILRKKVFLFREGNSIFVKWIGNEEQRPFFINSAIKKLVYSPERKIISFRFFPGRNDAMIVLLDDGTLNAVEIDTRFEIHNISKLEKNCTKFAVSDELLYYVMGGNLYSIDFAP